MKNALISPNETRYRGYRIAQVEPDDRVFPVMEPLYWLACDDQVIADQWYFDTATNSILAIPVVVTTTSTVISTGTQTL